MINLETIERILVTRTDRIGDVVLSTPVLEALRMRFPQAWIAVMVAVDTRELVEGNPYIDEVIVYDKLGPEKSWLGTWRFAREIYKKDFDIAIHLHPTNRVHWVSYLARIPVRLGYRYKNYRLLTNVIPHLKQEGKKHEAQYNFDLLAPLGINPPEHPEPHIPLSETAHQQLEKIKSEAGLAGHSYVVLSPGSSCPSKMWAPSRFAELGNLVAKKYQVPVVLIGSEKEKALASQISSWMDAKPVNLAGRLTLGETAWLLKGSRLLVSNDSGPVHIAGAVGTPVISIFGRKQPGLGPVRWGPLAPNSKVIHKDVGCEVCLAHRCTYSFLCLDQIQVSEVMEAVEHIEASLNR